VGGGALSALATASGATGAGAAAPGGGATGDTAPHVQAQKSAAAVARASTDDKLHPLRFVR
jgi:hypothetical protein